MNMPIFVRSPASPAFQKGAEVPFQLWHWGIFGAGLLSQCLRHAEVSTPGQIWSNPGSFLKARASLYAFGVRCKVGRCFRRRRA